MSGTVNGVVTLKSERHMFKILIFEFCGWSSESQREMFKTIPKIVGNVWYEYSMHL